MKIRQPQLEPRSLKPHVLVPTGHIFLRKKRLPTEKANETNMLLEKKRPRTVYDTQARAGKRKLDFLFCYLYSHCIISRLRDSGNGAEHQKVCERHLKRHMKNRGESREKVGKKSGWEEKKWRQRTARTMQKWADKGKEQRSKTENPSWQKQTFLISYRKVVPLQNPISNVRKEAIEKEWITCIEVQVP